MAKRPSLKRCLKGVSLLLALSWGFFAFAHDPCKKALLFIEWARQNGAVFQLPGPMSGVADLVEQASKTDQNVLIFGETGTGKELIARAIHDLSERGKAGQLYIPVDSTHVPGIGDTYFFGAEKGAFTDSENMIGIFEAAQGGTVFIDEIGKLPLLVQKVLVQITKASALDRKITRVGGTSQYSTPVRIIAATNIDLWKEVQHGRFSQELYFALSGMLIPLLPLNQRKEEIIPLAAHFLNRINIELGRVHPGFSSEARRLLNAYSWSGNIRELRHLIEQAVILSDTQNGLIHFTGTAGNRPKIFSDPAANQDIALRDAAPFFNNQKLFDFSKYPYWHEVLANLSKIGRADRDLLIIGESGLGRQILAQFAHAIGPRSQKEMVVVDCKGLNSNLLQTILFGHTKGAFTGAISDHDGLIKLANGSDLLLIGIEALSLEAQGFFLRFLDQSKPELRIIQRMGKAQKSFNVNVRVIATAAHDLAALVDAGKFREDLYHRLIRGGKNSVPALRDHPDSIVPLALHLLQNWNENYGSKVGKNFSGFTSSALSFIQNYAWPGNISELSMVISRNCALSPGGQLELIDRPKKDESEIFFSEVSHFTTKQLRELLIKAALVLENGIQLQAGKRLNIHRQHLNKEVDRSSIRDWLKKFLEKDEEILADSLLKLAISYLKEYSGLTIQEMNQQFIQSVLEKYHFNVTRAAESLGMSRTWLSEKSNRLKRK